MKEQKSDWINDELGGKIMTDFATLRQKLILT